MSHILTAILQHKQEEIAGLYAYVQAYPNSDLNQLFSGKKKRLRTHSLHRQLKADGLSVIAEIKRRSPSKEHLATIPDVAAMATQYISGQASAISVLTDQKFFSGSLSDLATVSSLTATTACAVLRKDFIIDPIQICEAIVHGADAILLIVTATQEKTKDLLQMATELNIEAVVEVHTLQELETALAINAAVIAVNNRNLNTFNTDIQHSLELVKYIPANIVKISCSGIHTPEQAHMMYQAGFDAILVGEALVRSSDPTALIQQMRSVL